MRKLKVNAWRLEFGFGVELDKAGKRLSVYTRLVGLEIIRNTALELYGGCTMVKTEGDWTDPKTGIQHCEAGRTVIVYIDKDSILRSDYGRRKRSLIVQIKKSLRQAAVAFCATEVRFQVL